MLASAAATLAPRPAAAGADPLLVGPTPLPSPDQQPDAVAAGRNRFHHLTAPVMLNDQGPFTFIVDTGASRSCISNKLVQMLALPIQPSLAVHTMVGVRMHPVALVNELRVGVRRQRRLAALSIPIDEPGAEGVLAVDWLKGQRVTLNFARSSLEFAVSGEQSSSPGQVVVPARRKLGQLTIVDAHLGDRRVSAMIDSGSEISLCNTPLLSLLDRAQAVPAKRQMIEMVTVIGEAFSGELVYLPFLRLGGLQLGNVGVARSDSHVFDIWGLTGAPAVLLGMDLLRQFRAISLDFGCSQVRFDLI
jgi:hypothetical protein